ncbi:MAG: AAA family ATPase [Ilumatobacteraceae bacterium]
MSTRAGGGDPSMLSNHLRDRLTTGRQTPGMVVVNGAVMLSDVVAFTSHIETMSELGRSAIEVFSVRIGEYLDQVINLVAAHGGDVLDIAGDSLLCLWEAADDGDGLRAATAAAASTALAIQSSMHGHQLGHGRTIETRIGVCVGPVSLTVAGGVDDRWELMTQGDTIAMVEEAERRCAPGSVTVDDAALKLLGGDASSLPMGEGLHQLTSLDHLVEPKAFASTTDSEAADQLWAMEFRRLSIAMARVPELAGASPDTAHRILRLFQTITAEREGVSGIVTDNKGIRLLATFGAPPRAHEDDPARAVDAMRAFAAALVRENSTCSAGIATGRAVYGIAGNATRRATTMAGEVINVAARLSTTARGNVLCDQESAVGAHARYTFTVLNPIIVKGKALPVPVFEPVGEVLARRKRTASMRGRVGELDRLSNLLEPAATRSVDAVVVVGDAGLGKTTLLDDFVDLAGNRGQRVLVAKTDAIDRTTPFLAWTSVINELLGIRLGGVDTTHDAITERVRALLGPDLAPRASTVATVFGRFASGRPIDSADDEPSTLIPQALAEMLTAGGERPVIVFEDSHWADTGSLTVLRALRTLANPPPMVVSTRPDALENLANVIGESRTEVISLTPLGTDAVRQIIVDRLGTERVPQRLVEFVNDRVAGHPYFCEQLLKSLVENGTIVINGPAVTLGVLDGAAIPSTVEGVIVSRLDRFDLESQQCLKAASVVGRRHLIETVQACLPTVDVAAVLEGMGADGLLRRVNDSTFEFQHVIARDVVYDLMTEQQRRQLHRIVADQLERSGRGVGAATVGRHWRQAGEHAVALEYLERAASDALGSGSFAGTVALLDEADEVCVAGALHLGADQRARLALQRARASYYLGLLTDARRELEMVISLIGDPLPTTEAEHVAEHERLEALRRANPPTAGPHEARPTDAADAVLFETYRTLVKVLYLLGDTGHAIVTVAIRGLTYADKIRRPYEAAAIQAMLCGAYATIGNVERFEYHSRCAVEVAESPEGGVVANHIWRMLAVAHAALGQWAASLDASDRALAALDSEGQNRDAGIWQTRAAVHLCAGEFGVADQAWRRTAQIAVRDGNNRLSRWSRLDEAQTLIGRDLVTEADEVLSLATIELGPPSDPLGTIEQHYTTAIVRSAQGRHAEAVREARNVVRMIEGAPPSGFHWVEFCSGAAEAMLAALLDPGDPPSVDRDALIPEVEHVIDLLDGFGKIFLHVAPRVPLARALLAHVRGEREEASRLLHEARAMALAGDFEFDAARCTVLFWWLGFSGERPDIDEARDTLARLGALRWLGRADSALLRRSDPPAHRLTAD